MGGSLKTVCVCGNIDLRLLIGGRPAPPARETTWCYSSWQSTPEPTSTIPDKMAGYENRVSMKARNNFIGVCLLQARRKSINPQSLTLQGFSAPLSTMWSPHKPQHQLKPIQYRRRNMFFFSLTRSMFVWMFQGWPSLYSCRPQPSWATEEVSTGSSPGRSSRCSRWR